VDLRILRFSIAAQIGLARKAAEALLGEERALVIDPVLASKEKSVVGLDETDAPAVVALHQFANSAFRELLGKKDGEQFLMLWLPSAAKAQPKRTCMKNGIVPGPRRAGIRLHIKVSVAVALGLVVHGGAANPRPIRDTNPVGPIAGPIQGNVGVWRGRAIMENQ
jgi:hypothetical protein